jgi:hypothetical protein
MKAIPWTVCPVRTTIITTITILLGIFFLLSATKVSAQPTLPPGWKVLSVTQQPESRDATGKITVEASIIHVVAKENGEQFYVYQYVNRPGFRTIRPPDWGHAIGGQDYPTFEQAVAAAQRTPCPPGQIELLGVCSDSVAPPR